MLSILVRVIHFFILVLHKPSALMLVPSKHLKCEFMNYIPTLHAMACSLRLLSWSSALHGISLTGGK